MEQIDYSVIIRTTGKAGGKYQQLLDSISALEPGPKEVLVVLPEGYDLPEERLGWESFYFCQRGMVRQRLYGLSVCTTPYALFCDDDVSFPPHFVQLLHAPLAKGEASFSIAPLYSFLPDPGVNTLVCTIMASAVPTLLHRHSRYVSVLKSTGYSYNRHLDRKVGRYYETQSAAWTCFFASVSAFRLLELEKESWLDAHGYSALDDQTMFYKAWLKGMKTVVVAHAEYEHLDGRTSTRNNRPAAIYSSNFNRVVFWHRFLYSQAGWLGKLGCRIAFSYYLCWHMLRNTLSVLRRRMTKENWKLSRKGVRDGRRYLRTEEYRSLPPVSGKGTA